MNTSKITLALAASFFIGQVHAGGGEPAEPPPPPAQAAPVEIISSAPAQHSLGYAGTANDRKIVTSSKTVDGQLDRIFRDGFGREVNFRGFNVSGKVKLVQSGFKPFMNTQDAATSFDELGKKNGANQVRFTIAWEGVHPSPDVIDEQYLAQIVAQMKEAIRNRMYIVVDYHSDLYSRHTFTKDSRDTGNGAPEWIVKGGNHGTDDCGLPCLFSWGAHKLNDNAVRSAMRAFWLNSDVTTDKGTRQVQDEFLWQVGKVADYLKANLSAEEFDYVLGIEPLNEPFEAGLKELGLKDYAEFDNQMLWPFYERMRDVLDAEGWNDKWVFAEPMVFWSSITTFAPATGGGYLNYKPGDGFVFAPHFYDQGRMGTQFDVPRNGTYFSNLDNIRKEARFLDLPIFLGEFGMWLEGKGHTDGERIINATYQGMEMSDVNHGKDRFADFYTAQVGGTQWQWDYYYDNHYELQNGNPDKVKTEDDAWNGENFSVIKEYAQGYNVDANLVERLYARRVQGDVMNFHYNAMVSDRAAAPLSWAALRVADSSGESNEYFRGKKFALLTWRGRNADAPTEIFIPRHFDISKMLVMTESSIKSQTLSVSNSPANVKNEVLLTTDPAKASNGGHRLAIWDDVDAGENQDTLHYALIVDDANLTEEQLVELQSNLNQLIRIQKKNPVYLTGQMTHGGYPDDK